MKLLITMFLFAAAQTGLARVVTFTQLDLDKDGYITISEVKDNELVSDFDIADLNADGKLSRSEYAQYRSATLNQMNDQAIDKKGQHAKTRKIEGDKADM
ncbi:MAG: hypothetical protein CMP10_05335 [Zetaproteobacteria bacterium]|nr:hypothetical protein [Pseudobdellovibrionaceae bacterium]|tara:strand:- start:229 stop:528 length:300 start_codon:yes stop_codon:yes gene_type:complete